jgi:hypothetical protein
VYNELDRGDISKRMYEISYVERKSEIKIGPNNRKTRKENDDNGGGL